MVKDSTGNVSISKEREHQMNKTLSSKPDVPPRFEHTRENSSLKNTLDAVRLRQPHQSAESKQRIRELNKKVETSLEKTNELLKRSIETKQAIKQHIQMGITVNDTPPPEIHGSQQDMDLNTFRDPFYNQASNEITYELSNSNIISHMISQQPS